MRRRAGIVAAILAKDLRAFARDRFYVFVSILGLVFYVAIFWVLPGSVDETVSLGLHLDEGPAALAEVAGGSAGLEVERFDDEGELADAVEAGTVAAGLAFPDGFVAAVAAGEDVTVRVLLTGDAPEELRPALSGMVRELAFAVAGEQLPVRAPELDEIVLGVDRTGEQLSLRDQMRPLFVFFVLMVEMFALASLVAAEIHGKTITSILVTPARVGDVLAAKVVLGTLLAFSQAALLVAALGALGSSPALLLVTLLLGAVLVTGLGLVAGSTGADFIGIVFWSIALMLPLMVPALSSLFPGAPALWIRALPSYGLVQVIIGTSSYGEGWREAAPHLLTLLAWCAAVFVAGVGLLHRRVTRL